MSGNTFSGRGAAHPNSRWSQEERDEIAILLRKGQTASKIASRFGRSRNAVIGVVSRDPALRKIGFVFRNGQNDIVYDKSIAASASNRRKTVRGGLVSLNRLKSAPASPKPAPKMVAVQPQTAGVPLLDLGPRQCKFCINEPERGANAHLFCGEVTEIGKSWCAWHEQIVWGRGTAGETATVKSVTRIAA